MRTDRSKPSVAAEDVRTRGAAGDARLALLQISLIVHDLASTIADFEKTLGLRVAFRDPGVMLWGLENAVLPMGATFIELLSPVREDTPGGRHLARQGGDGGYMVILQTDALDAWRPRLAEQKVRIAWEGEVDDPAYGAKWAGLHLHPQDTGGMMISIDRPDPPDSWAGAGPSWREFVSQEVVNGLTGITMRSPNPDRLATRWAETLGRPRGAEGQIELDRGRVDFVAAVPSEPEGLAGVSLSASDRADVGKRFMLGGVCFELD